MLNDCKWEFVLKGYSIKFFTVEEVNVYEAWYNISFIGFHFK